MSLDDATAALLRELTNIHDTIPRCARCECFLVVAAQARIDLRRVDSPTARTATEVLAGWLDEAEGHVKSCNNCEVCVPGGPYRRFTEELASASGATAGGSGAGASLDVPA
jgi:hypothetical protein